ncbi:hypothetical protein Forpi1262_v001868 [Fusarium oxysporum f. sp. raphani]|uniref:Uncharacterized protein n=1 Tax=Fusarium oxysporum f. sp. raphani TaxID=96318 RepID=A0A8J5UDF9_FUSOX|nr:hypothetical protein Forpi1262_v001868 [Fusarium oxysporum f. sp. raphani]KAK2688372.1 hypothetical protein QWA68_012398 [Fusarium oxysporum]
MAKTKSRIQPFLEAVRNARQLIFTVIVIAIFAIAWLVQGGSIDMPEWTKDMRHLEGDDWTKYAVIIIVAVLLMGIPDFRESRRPGDLSDDHENK